MKEYTVTVKLNIDYVGIVAESEEGAIEKTKRLHSEEHNLDLLDEEIQKVEKREI